MAIAPVPNSPEVGDYTFERKVAPAQPGLRGPLRYEEGLGTDPDVGPDFTRGATEALSGAPGHPNWVDPNTQHKTAAETLRERMHPGSAAWTESPTFRGEFAADAMQDYATPSYRQVDRSGGRYQRVSPALITD